MNILELEEQPPGVLDKLPVATLHNLQIAAEAHAADASRTLSILHGVMERRYATGLNDAGTHHRTDGDYDVTITVPKNVSWEQSHLKSMMETVASWGENPADYIDCKLSVSESRYKAWSPAVRDLFAPARTVKPGKAKFVIAEREREAA